MEVNRHGSDAPAGHAFHITPNDSTVFANHARCLLLENSGLMKVDMLGGEEGVILPLQAGFNPVQVTKVYATDTTATGLIIGLY